MEDAQFEWHTRHTRGIPGDAALSRFTLLGWRDALRSTQATSPTSLSSWWKKKCAASPFQFTSGIDREPTGARWSELGTIRFLQSAIDLGFQDRFRADGFEFVHDVDQFPARYAWTRTTEVFRALIVGELIRA